MITGELAARRVVGGVLLGLCLLSMYLAWPNGDSFLRILQHEGLQLLIVPPRTGARAA